jgi:uncharacterized membrane protein YphA (DoxX/SURF4 family)
METFRQLDRYYIGFAKRYSAPIARIALFVIYFYFGFLKLIGQSPASSLAIGFAEKIGMANHAHALYLILAGVECLIGILILFPRLTRLALFIMLGHMLLVSAPLALYPEAVWTKPFVPSLEGQYIIKNAALVALALGLVAHTSPLRKSR